MGSPGDSGVKNPPAKAGDTGPSPDPGRSHMLWGNEAGEQGLLSWCPRARALWEEKPLQWGAQAPQLESSLRSPQLEKSWHSNEDPAQPIST